jgi:hypothetical protein
MSLVLVAAFVLPLQSQADVVAHVCHGPKKGPVRAIVEQGVCAGYRHDDGTQVRFPFKGSGSMIASADGRTVLMIQSYLSGQFDRRTGEIVGDEGQGDRKNPNGLYVYRDGVLVATHRIHELVQRRYLVQNSVSHFSWVRWAPEQISGPTFSITTTSFRDLAFDTATGKLLAANDSTEWLQCDVIATGEVDLAKRRLTGAYLPKTDEGGKSVAFTTEEFAQLNLTNRGTDTVCLEQRGDSLVLTRVLWAGR